MYTKKAFALTLIFLLVSTSCNSRIDRLLGQIDEAIRQVEITRGAVLGDMRNWRKYITELEGKVADDVGHIISEDVTELAENTVEHAGMEMRCELDFVESKIMGYLGALSNALKQIRIKAEKEGKLDQTIQTLLSEMINSRDLIQPWPCHTDDNLVFVWEKGRLRLKEDKPIEIVGFGMRRPLNEYVVELLDENRKVTDVVPGDTGLSDPTSYLLKVRLEKLPLKGNHRFISVSWNKMKLTELMVNVEETVEDPSKNQVAVFLINVKSHNDKDKRSAVNLQFLLNNHVLYEYPEYLRNVALKKDETDEIRVLSKFDVDGNDFYSVKLIWLNLPHKGRELDKKNAQNNFADIKWIKKGYERLGNKLILYEFPSTSNSKWEGEISFIRIFNKKGHEANTEFLSRPFSFSNGKSKDGTSTFSASWMADGTPQD